MIKATALDPTVVGADNVFRHEGPARVFTLETDAIRDTFFISPLNQIDFTNSPEAVSSDFVGSTR